MILADLFNQAQALPDDQRKKAIDELITDQNINDHHIFPSQVRGLDLDKSKLFNDYKNSIANRTLILNQTNIKAKTK